MNWLIWLDPWEFSPTLVVCFVLAAGLFLRGQRVHAVNGWRQTLFWLGLALLYFSLHTRLDYYAERMFFIHRTQHVILHHMGPLLLMAAYPGSVLRAGLPLAWRARLRRFNQSPLGRFIIGTLTQPVLVSAAFVLLVLVWLIPSVQFYTMLDWQLYRLMNWSVVISGILYWNLILDRRPRPPAAMSPGMRVVSPILTMTPQIIAGAILTFSERDFYPVFDVCGRALNFSAQFDQNLGGLILWIPAGMMEAIGGVIALRSLMRLSTQGRLKKRAPLAPPVSASTA